MSDIKNHWSGYINALGKTNSPSSTNSIPFETTSTKIGVSGFLDVKPTNTSAQFQPRYDAMSGSWEGVSASEKATLKQKSDKTEFMPYSSQ
jgi:hypothetical protein